MPPLAERNLFHDRVRLAVTLTGVVFAVVLIVVQLGLYVGFSRTTTALVDNSRADLWVVAKNVPYIEQGIPFSERKLYTVRATPGVAEAEKYIAHFSRWKRADGQEEGVVVVGVNPESTTGQAWDLVAGRREDLKVDDSVIVDRIYFEKLGVSRLGDSAEIAGRRARVVGFTQGIRTFTTSPYVFTNYRNALDYASLRDDQTMFILIQVQPGTNVESLRRRLHANLDGVDVLTRQQFSEMTRHYWLFTTGAGMAVLMAAALGLLVGVVVVAQTIYSSTMDHLREFGTLKAMGATNTYIYKIIMKQAVIAAIIGYALGISLSVLVVNESAKGGANIVLPWQLGVGMLGLTVAMCVTAAFRALDAVSLEVERGEVMLLMGPSGSGKTTLISILGCILRPTSGSVRILGEDVTQLPEEQLPRVRLNNIGFIFQGFNLFPTLTAGENVELALDLKRQSGPSARAKAKTYLEQVGMGEKYNSFPADLSGGQKQRVAIARALAADPQVILADEPTAALDSHSGRTVMDLLRDLAHRHGRAVVVVTHDNRVVEYGDRIVRIEDGRILSSTVVEPPRRLGPPGIAGRELGTGMAIPL